MNKYLLLSAIFAAIGCAGNNGNNGRACTVTSNPDGSATIACSDGTTTTIEPGTVGATGTTGATGATGKMGTDCSVSTDNGTGNATITCPGASTAVSAGLPPCGTLHGDFIVTGQFDLTTFQAAGCNEIDGNLVITDQFLTAVVNDLSALETVTTVTGYVLIKGYNSGVNQDPTDKMRATTLHLQNLATVGGFFEVDGMTWLTDADLASLTTVSGTKAGNHSVEFGSDGPLLSIELPLLTRVSAGVAIEYDYTLDGSSNLQTITLPKLATIPGDLYITNNPGQTTLDVGALVSIGGTLTVDSTTEVTLDFPKLTTVTGDIDIDGNNDLTSVTFDAAPVSVGGTVDINQDPALCTTPDPSTFSVTPTYTADGTSCP